MQPVYPSCAADVTITIDGDLPDFPIRVEWNREIRGRCVGVAIADSHQPASEVYHSEPGPDSCELSVTYNEDFLGVEDVYDRLLGVVHICERSGETGDSA